jgi:hypothetical protein
MPLVGSRCRIEPKRPSESHRLHLVLRRGLPLHSVEIAGSEDGLQHADASIMTDHHDVTVVRTTRQVLEEIEAPQIHLPQTLTTRWTGHLINDTPTRNAGRGVWDIDPRHALGDAEVALPQSAIYPKIALEATGNHHCRSPSPQQVARIHGDHLLTGQQVRGGAYLPLAQTGKPGSVNMTLDPTHGVPRRLPVLD